MTLSVEAEGPGAVADHIDLKRASSSSSFPISPRGLARGLARSGGQAGSPLYPNPVLPVIPDSVMPDSVMPDSVMPDSVMPDSVMPDSVMQDSVTAVSSPYLIVI